MDIGHEDNVTLHREVVTGVLQMIRFAVETIDSGHSPSLRELCDVGFAAKSDTAQMFICEYAKDGIINLRVEEARKIIAGDYSSIWSLTNSYLTGFGYDPIEPVALEI